MVVPVWEGYFFSKGYLPGAFQLQDSGDHLLLKGLLSLIPSILLCLITDCVTY